VVVYIDILRARLKEYILSNNVGTAADRIGDIAMGFLVGAAANYNTTEDEKTRNFIHTLPPFDCGE